jgi:ABC-type polysaccharide/polyol phosphate transport system ATPase subunit
MATAISFDNVTKRYRGGRQYRSLRDDLTGIVRRRPARDVVTALDDLTLEIAEGESFAIIGHNGAGKTTALKLATRIAFPTAGRIRVRGRVGALIEVGTGMHPELTGRENVMLYGRILGLSRADVRRRFDQIIEFAGIGAALEQPVKQFSSGMQLRLGFALAAHLEPDVLVVDEAIAVGDAAFQYRCVERMGELVRSGRTLVFVSHDMSAVEALCNRGVILDGGRIRSEGPAREIVREYLAGVEAELTGQDSESIVSGGGPLEVERVTFHDDCGEPVGAVPTGEPITARIHYRTREPVHGPIFELGITDGRLGALGLASMFIDGNVPETLDGRGYVECRFESLPLLPRTYELHGGVLTATGVGELVPWQRLGVFRITGEVAAAGKGAVSQLMEKAPVVLDYSWDVRDGADGG